MRLLFSKGRPIHLISGVLVLFSLFVKSGYSESSLEPEIRSEVNKLTNMTTHDLTEVQTENGVVMDLRGRQRAVAAGTINEDGKLTVDIHRKPIQSNAVYGSDPVYSNE